MVVEGFARFITGDVGAGLLLPGLLWTSDAVAQFRKGAWSDRTSIQDALVDVLRAAWKREHGRVTSDDTYRVPFERLLAILVARGFPIAQSFRDEVLDSVGAR